AIARAASSPRPWLSTQGTECGTPSPTSRSTRSISRRSDANYCERRSLSNHCQMCAASSSSPRRIAAVTLPNIGSRNSWSDFWKPVRHDAKQSGPADNGHDTYCPRRPRTFDHCCCRQWAGGGQQRWCRRILELASRRRRLRIHCPLHSLDAVEPVYNRGGAPHLAASRRRGLRSYWVRQAYPTSSQRDGGIDVALTESRILGSAQLVPAAEDVDRVAQASFVAVKLARRRSRCVALDQGLSSPTVVSS